MFAMFLSQWLLFRCCLKSAHRFGPHLVEVGTQPCHSLGVQLVKPPRSRLAVGHQPHILQHTQVLRHRRTAHRQRPSQFVYGSRPARELSKDCHARGITQCVKAGL